MPVPKIEVRVARESDAAFVERLSGEVFSEYTPGAAPRTAAMTQVGGAKTLVITVDGGAAGFAVFRLTADVAYLDAIAVERTQRGRNLGRGLLSEAENLARQHGARIFRLVTADANLAALELFFKAGYFIERRLQRYYPRGQNALGLVKRLS